MRGFCAAELLCKLLGALTGGEEIRLREAGAGGSNPLSPTNYSPICR